MRELEDHAAPISRTQLEFMSSIYGDDADPILRGLSADEYQAVFDMLASMFIARHPRKPDALQKVAWMRQLADGRSYKEIAVDAGMSDITIRQAKMRFLKGLHTKYSLAELLAVLPGSDAIDSAAPDLARLVPAIREVAPVTAMAPNLEAVPSREATPADPEVQRRFEDNFGLVHVVMQGMYFQDSERDDVWNRGLYGLWEAADRYDPDKGSSFVSYAKLRIRSEIIELHRERQKLSRTTKQPREPTAMNGRVYLDAPISGEDGATNADYLVADAPGPEEQYIDDESAREQSALVRNLLATLPREQRDVVVARIMGQKNEAIGDAFGFTGSYASRLYWAAIKALRREVISLGLVDESPRHLGFIAIANGAIDAA